MSRFRAVVRDAGVINPRSRYTVITSALIANALPRSAAKVNGPRTHDH